MKWAKVEESPWPTGYTMNTTDAAATWELVLNILAFKLRYLPFTIIKNYYLMYTGSWIIRLDEWLSISKDIQMPTRIEWNEERGEGKGRR